MLRISQHACFIESSIMPGSAMQYSCPPAYHLPSGAVTVPRSDPRCQNPLAIVAAGSLQYCPQVAADDPVQVGKTAFPGAVEACEAVQRGEPALLSDFACKTRPAGEYIGYTYHHLPNCPKNIDAIPANFAARIAFSSLRIRCGLKYGPKACNKLF